MWDQQFLGIAFRYHEQLQVYAHCDGQLDSPTLVELQVERLSRAALQECAPKLQMRLFRSRSTGNHEIAESIKSFRYERVHELIVYDSNLLFITR